jgi:hypothetical protein
MRVQAGFALAGSHVDEVLKGVAGLCRLGEKRPEVPAPYGVIRRRVISAIEVRRHEIFVGDDASNVDAMPFLEQEILEIKEFSLD